MALPPQFLSPKEPFVDNDLANIVETDIDCKLHGWINRGGSVQRLDEGVCLHFSFLDPLDESVCQRLNDRFRAVGWDSVEVHYCRTRRSHAVLTLLDLKKYGHDQQCAIEIDFCHHPSTMFYRRQSDKIPVTGVP